MCRGERGRGARDGSAICFRQHSFSASLSRRDPSPYVVQHRTEPILDAGKGASAGGECSRGDPDIVGSGNRTSSARLRNCRPRPHIRPLISSLAAERERKRAERSLRGALDPLTLSRNDCRTKETRALASSSRATGDLPLLRKADRNKGYVRSRRCVGDASCRESSLGDYRRVGSKRRLDVLSRAPRPSHPRAPSGALDSAVSPPSSEACVWAPPGRRPVCPAIVRPLGLGDRARAGGGLSPGRGRASRLPEL